MYKVLRTIKNWLLKTVSLSIGLPGLQINNSWTLSGSVNTIENVWYKFEHHLQPQSNQWLARLHLQQTRIGFQRLPPARGGTAQRNIFRLANRSQLIYPGPSSSRSRFFMESSQVYAATLTHYSTEPLTTGPNYDPLLLLLALAGDVHPNPGPSMYPCSV